MIVHLLPKNEIFSIGNTLQGTGSGQEKLLKIGKEVEPPGGWHKTAAFRGEKSFKLHDLKSIGLLTYCASSFAYCEGCVLLSKSRYGIT